MASDSHGCSSGVCGRHSHRLHFIGGQDIGRIGRIAVHCRVCACSERVFEAMSGSGATLTVALYFYAKEEGAFDVAFAIASILMILTLAINLAATLAGKHFEKRRNA